MPLTVSKKLGNVAEAYPEDIEVWRHLNLRENPGWIEPVSLRLMVSGGYTSNARAGSPADPTVAESLSGLGRLDLFSRLVIPTSHFFRPALEGDVKAHGLTEREARDLTYLDLSIRLHFDVNPWLPRKAGPRSTYRSTITSRWKMDRDLMKTASRTSCARMRRPGPALHVWSDR